MKRLFILSGILACIISGCKRETVTVYPGILVSGYVSGNRVDSADNATYHSYDRVIYASITPDAAGVFQLSAADSLNLLNLKSKLTANQQLFVSIRDTVSSSKGLAALSADGTKRSNFVNAVTAFCLRWKIQGVDLNWEMTGTPPTAPALPNAADYATLSQQLAAALHSSNLLFTEAIGVYYTQLGGSVVSPPSSYYNLAELTHNWTDQIHLIAYGPYAIDATLYQAPMVQAQNWLGNLLNYGVPASKITLGVPFSGYHANITSVDSTANFITYRSIVAQARPIPSANMFMNYGFNGVDLIRKKTAYLKQYGFGGVLASDISHDTTVASGYSLTRTLAGAKK